MDQTVTTYITVDDTERAQKMLGLRMRDDEAAAKTPEPKIVVPTKIELKQQVQREKYKQEFEQDRRNREKAMQETERRRNMKFEKNLTALKQERETLVEEVRAMLAAHDNEVHRRKKQLYDEWETNVYNEIQTRVKEKVEEKAEGLNPKKRELYDRYLKTVERKKVGGIYRDILIDDYDPLGWRAEVPVASLSIDDPLDRPLRERAREHKRVGLPAPARHAPRDTVPVEKWEHPETTGLIGMEAMASKVSQPNPNAQSSIKIDHYNVLQGNEHAAADYPTGGKAIHPQQGNVSRLFSGAD